MARLSMGVLTPKEDRSIRSLHELLTQGKLRSKFLFPDTGFITTSIQEQFWELGNTVIAFPEMIVAELSGWLRTPIHNSYLHDWLPRALEKCRTDGRQDGPLQRANVLGTVRSKLEQFNVAILDRSAMVPYGYEYYVNLLSVRKRLGIRVERNLLNEIGGPPTDEQMRDHLGKHLHERVAPIAFKGWKDQGKRNFTADEELVVSAAITAIMTGKSTVVVTRDTDVFEQSMKLFELLVSDYVCHRFAEVRFLNPSGVPMYPLFLEPSTIPELGIRGNTIECVAIPDHEAEGLPPYEHTPVHCFCVLCGNTCDDPKISIAGFCLEKEMSSLLLTKTETNGLNTSRFPGKNIVTGSKQHADGKIEIMFALCELELMDYEGISISRLDLRSALKGDPAVA